MFLQENTISVFLFLKQLFQCDIMEKCIMYFDIINILPKLFYCLVIFEKLL